MSEMDETLASEPGAASSVIAAGTQLGKYKLIRQIGAGAMGQVWAAHDPDLERQVAVKLLKSDKAVPQLRTRLLREARAMARLKHANVLTVYEVGSEGERDYIVMELVDGTNLDQWLSIRPPVEEIWAALFAAGRGIAAAHRAGLVHRDFKPHNVLRSSDCRVLVTDFGLARGVADEPVPPGSLPGGEVALATTLDLSSKDSLLDSPLTQTGALIGTPAYMAPEQYIGAVPDPRTDQFAFCVTAWQALTGERPFQGTTLDDLRRATSRGVGSLKVKLSPRVRAVLARGLDPDPEKRWDTIDDLLDALERARKPRRVWPYVFPAFAAVAAIVLAMSMTRKHAASPAASPTGCVEPELAYLAWNDDMRAEMQKRVGTQPSELVTRYLDETRREWLQRYATACKAPPTPKTYAQIACLLAERDEASLFVAALDTVAPAAFARVDVTGALARPAACALDAPVGPPAMPEDQMKRIPIVGVLAQVEILRYQNPAKLVEQRDRWESNAKKQGWDALVAMVDLEIGRAAEMTSDYPIARDYITRAADVAGRVRDFELEASARLALLQTESQATADPADPDREAKLAKEAHDAIARASGDQDVELAIDQTTAANYIARTAMAPPASSLPTDPWSVSTGAPRAAIRFTALRMQVLTAQQQYEQAYALGKTHEASEITGGPVHAQIEREMVELARRIGNLDDAHARADQLRTSMEGGSVALVGGEVRDARGAPVPHARVIAWQGTLYGDGRRIYTSPDFIGDEDTTDEDGHYSLAAPIGGAVMAERDDLRAGPIAVADGKPMPPLVLAPTRTLAGKVAASSASKVPTLDAFVQLQAGTGIWRDRAPVATDASYRITGVPAHAEAIGLVRLEDHGEHVVQTTASDGATLTWPAGATLDVIVKKPGTIRVTRGKDARDVASAETGPIGFSSITTEGRASYTKDGNHAVLRDISPGPVTVCTTGSQTCTTVTVPASGTIAIVLE